VSPGGVRKATEAPQLEQNFMLVVALADVRMFPILICKAGVARCVPIAALWPIASGWS